MPIPIVPTRLAKALAKLHANAPEARPSSDC